MKHRFILCLATATTLALAACGDDSPGSTPGTGALRIVNAISDSQPIDASVTNVTTDLNNIAFGSASGFREIPEGSYKVQLNTHESSGAAVSITADNVSIDHNNQTTVYAIGSLTLGTQSSLAVERTIADIPANNVEVQFVDVAGAGGTVSLIKAGTSALDPANVVATQTLEAAVTAVTASDPTKAYSAPQQVPTGTYEIVITTAGGLKVYDSGSAGIALSGGSSYQFAVLNGVGISNGSAVTVLEMDDKGNTTPLPASP
jgi:hypothetical protein